MGEPADARTDAQGAMCPRRASLSSVAHQRSAGGTNGTSRLVSGSQHAAEAPGGPTSALGQRLGSLGSRRRGRRRPCASVRSLFGRKPEEAQPASPGLPGCLPSPAATQQLQLRYPDAPRICSGRAAGVEDGPGEGRGRGPWHKGSAEMGDGDTTPSKASIFPRGGGAGVSSQANSFKLPRSHSNASTRLNGLLPGGGAATSGASVLNNWAASTFLRDGAAAAAQGLPTSPVDLGAAVKDLQQRKRSVLVTGKAGARLRTSHGSLTTAFQAPNEQQGKASGLRRVVHRATWWPPWCADDANAPCSVATSQGVLFSPDGEYVMVWGCSPELKLLAAEDGKLIMPFAAHNGNNISYACFNEDGSKIAAATGTSEERGVGPRVRPATPLPQIAACLLVAVRVPVARAAQPRPPIPAITASAMEFCCPHCSFRFASSSAEPACPSASCRTATAGLGGPRQPPLLVC
jgi:hypothetical protein